MARSPRRCGSSWRRAVRGRGSCLPAARRSDFDPRGELFMTRCTFAVRTLAGIVALLVLSHASPSGTGRKFYNDDPMAREPESQNASAVEAWDIDLFYDLAENLFGHPGEPGPAGHARNVNTIDEVPDSSWFVNRILA